MLKLSGKYIPIQVGDPGVAGGVFRVTTGDYDQSTLPRNSSALLVRSKNAAQGFGAYLIMGGTELERMGLGDNTLVVELPNDFSYLSEGDVIRLSPNENRIRVLYRRGSNHNAFLVTERCDNYCLMCSQPPRNVDDDWVLDEILEVLPLMDPNTKEIGFTGGEPTLLGERFLNVLRVCKEVLPKTSVHVLSNGRKFSDESYARNWAAIKHNDLMVGIPLYSDVASVHNYVVQAEGAYDQTLKGILNLKMCGQRVEIRVVLHKATFSGLPRLAQFISRNLLFVDHVALMGLEIMGFTRANLDELWIDPIDYQVELVEAVHILESAGLKVSIYNHQLCLLDQRLWKYAVRSISDWKNEYFEECAACAAKQHCGGFFSSAKYKRSGHIHPLSAMQVEGGLRAGIEV